MSTHDLDEIYTSVVRLEARVNAMEIVQENQKTVTNYLAGQITGLTGRLDEMREMLARTDNKLAEVQSAVLGAFREHEAREQEELARTLEYRRQRAEQELEQRKQDEKETRKRRIEMHLALATIVVTALAFFFDNFVSKLS